MGLFSDNQNAIYAEVLLPLALPQLFTYRVPDSLADEAVPGKRVIVPFGRQKVYSGLICNISDNFEDPGKVKEIQSILDDLPIVNERQLKFWQWMAAYYMCSQGEVMNSALPAALKLQSETVVQPVDLPEDHEIELTDNEELILSKLKEKKQMTIDEISALLNRISVHQILKRAFDKGLIIMSEEIHEKYKPKKEQRLRLAESFQTDAALEQLFNEFESDPRKAKQLSVLMVFLKFLFEDKERASVKKSDIVRHADVSKSAIQTLLNNGILVEFDIQVERIPLAGKSVVPPSALSEGQSQALDEIRNQFAEHDVTLLHGVTSSGKTELYIHLIEEAIQNGKQVLYLLPEIALTTQIIIRLKKHFGDKVGVYHSRYSGSERVEIWNHVLSFNNSAAHYNTRSQIILGARSALFLPYKDLGLIIVDEEHDSSYKQMDPAPRYHGRDSAIMLAKIHDAKVLLGSATPSLESYYNARHQRFGIVTLKERHGGMEMPQIVIADMKEAKKKKLMKSIFTPQLLDAITEALTQNEQVILFQNRRGFSPFIECRNCNWIPHCKNCSVTLTYHKNNNSLRCHYCGYMETVPGNCPECQDFHLEVKGFGTEKIEEEIGVFFPEATIARMDLDSTRSKSSYQRIIADFEERRINILVGTQMVTKGLDFDNVSTVGILNADQLLNFPDFRAHERGFQLMSQVSGRSGRKIKRGKVIIQTYQPEHWVLRDVIQHNYDGFFHRDLAERLKYAYPPHSRMIELTLRHKDDAKVQNASMELFHLLKELIPGMVNTPVIPLVSKIRNLYLRNIIVRIPKTQVTAEVKNNIRKAINKFYGKRDNLSVNVIPDVDPN